MGRMLVPDPQTRVSVDLWLQVRGWLLQNDPDASEMLRWSNEAIRRPETAEAVAGEIIWIILCAGKSAQAARTIEARVWKAIRAGTPVFDAFGHRGKAPAMENVWRDRDQRFSEVKEVLDDLPSLLAWCRSLPWVGQITSFQLMKNFGVDCVKPDIWLSRLAGIPDRPAGRSEVRFDACMDLCRPLAASSGDRIAAVDSLLWLACNKGVVKVSAMAGEISLDLSPVRARTIYEPAA